MSQPVLSLDLPQHIKIKLLQNGYRTVSDFGETTPTDLLSFLTKAEVQQLDQVTNSKATVTTAWALLEKVDTRPHVRTHRYADVLLGNSGLALGTVTEVFGAPGCGQPDLCLAACFGAQLSLQETPGKSNAIYIDTIGSFTQRGATDTLSRMGGHSTLSLAGIQVLRTSTLAELISLLTQIDQVIAKIGGVGVMVINSISWPFLAAFPNNMLRRQRMQTEVAHMISHIADRHNVAVLVISNAKSAANNNALVAQDGDAWARISANQLCIQRSGDNYLVRLVSSAAYPAMERRIKDPRGSVVCE
ncbi:hypothetical protein EC988_001196 [Linderina pennispora]|nr:hypothetical protein EC988_001196 [Linderina pennispora]